MNTKEERNPRCTVEVYDGWEDSYRCLLDSGHAGSHNYLSPENELQKKRFKDNNES